MCSLLINSLCGLSDVRKLWKRPVTTSHSVRWHLQTSDDSSRSVSGLIRHILMDRHQLKWLLHCTPQLSSTTAGSTEQHFAAYQSENKSVWMWIIMWLYWWLTLLWHPIGKTQKNQSAKHSGRSCVALKCQMKQEADHKR